MKKRSIKTQLILSFLTISILIIGTLSVLTLSLMNNHFNQFVEEKQDELMNQYVDSLELIYQSNQHKWSETELEALTQKTMENHLYFSIDSSDNKTIWQLPKTELKKKKETLKRHANKVSKTKGATLNEEVVVTKPLKKKNTSFGQVNFYFYGPFAYTEHDAMFISSMKKSLMTVALVALLISFIFASWISQKLSLPLKHVSQFTHQLTVGKYTETLPQETSINEINLLIDSLNDLSYQLEKQANLRKQLTSDISHELRTPLATLKGNIEALMDGIWEATPERLQSCYDEVDRLTRLVGNLELINKIEEKKEALVMSEFDLYDLIQSIMINFSSKIEEKDLRVTAEGKSLMVTADKDKMNQVLTNLLSNAIKFTQKNGQITFLLKQEKNKTILQIKDNGMGIEKEQLPFIFDRFYMVDTSRNREIGGQGIGLSIVKGAIEAHQGNITVESQLGIGTTFTITLPN
ncbi:sensor histidine kinase [Vagococcus carniphilus]|uniref:sensor histidine kinase n=1 Tax=Vagococcus carniphilus TaxID=218144 RepID=UPI003B5A4873